jgi:hypothetical protein
MKECVCVSLIVHADFALRDPELVFDPVGINPGAISHYLSQDRRENIFQVHVKYESGKFIPFRMPFVSNFLSPR